jgi:heptaprenyl diphosphate synthase
VTSVTHADADFEAFVRRRIDAIEGRLTQTAAAQTAFTSDAAQHLLAAGGKRFRPLLVVLASQLYPGADESAIDRAAIVMELTHVASLYHDDVMDEADVRRGVPSANSRWGNTVAIMVGDFLFARASSTVATLGTEYVMLQAETFARLVQGQIAETRGLTEGEDPLRHYLDVIADKTGSLIAASTVFGGMVCGARRRCWTRWPPTARRSGWSSSCPTTCSTSPPTTRARPRARTCAKASRRCRCSC